MSDIKDQIENAIRNMPADHCKPGTPKDYSLPLCEHRAYAALCEAIESLKRKSPQAEVPDDQFFFLPAQAFAEVQELFPLDVVREIIVVLAAYLDIPPCDCGATDEQGAEIDPDLCGGVFTKILNEVFECPPEN